MSFFKASRSSELFGVELTPGIACGRLLVEGLQGQLVRPPVLVRRAALRFARERALLFVVHVDVNLYCRSWDCGLNTVLTQDRPYQ